MNDSMEIMGNIREICGYGEEQRAVRLWETGMDELQQEDCVFEAQHQDNDTVFGDDEMGWDEMDESGHTDDANEGADISMVPADKRQMEIFQWLLCSPMADPVKGGGEGDFMITGGWPIQLKDGPVFEAVSWLESEGFQARLLIEGYTVSREESDSDEAASMVFRRRQVVEAPFETKSYNQYP